MGESSGVMSVDVNVVPLEKISYGLRHTQCITHVSRQGLILFQSPAVG